MKAEKGENKLILQGKSKSTEEEKIGNQVNNRGSEQDCRGKESKIIEKKKSKILGEEKDYRKKRGRLKKKKAMS